MRQEPCCFLRLASSCCRLFLFRRAQVSRIQGITAWHDAGFIFQGSRVFDRSVLLRRHSALDDCTGGARDRAKPERLLQLDAVETISKILESAAIPMDEKLFFIHMAAGRALNSDLYEKGKMAAKKIQEKKNPSALDRKLAAGIADTGVMDAPEY